MMNATVTMAPSPDRIARARQRKEEPTWRIDPGWNRQYRVLLMRSVGRRRIG